MPAETSLADLAGAILDGTPVDWQLADSGADEYDRSLLNQLRVLAAVADVHRRAPDDGGRIEHDGAIDARTFEIARHHQGTGDIVRDDAQRAAHAPSISRAMMICWICEVPS